MPENIERLDRLWQAATKIESWLKRRQSVKNDVRSGNLQKITTHDEKP